MKRSDDDPIWAGLWHTPGTVIRAFDETLGDGIDRLLTDELHNDHIGRPRYVGHLLHRVLRGTELALVHWVETKPDATIGQFFDVEDLPELLVDSQRPFIHAAVQAYQASRAGQ